MTVRWTETARNELADFWLRADSVGRRQIVAAAHAVDRRLQIDAGNEGESRPNGRRVLFEPPLGILFRVEQSGSAVDVLRVWQFK